LTVCWPVTNAARRCGVRSLLTSLAQTAALDVAAMNAKHTMLDFESGRGSGGRTKHRRGLRDRAPWITRRTRQRIARLTFEMRPRRGAKPFSPQFQISSGLLIHAVTVRNGRSLYRAHHKELQHRPVLRCLKWRILGSAFISLPETFGRSILPFSAPTNVESRISRPAASFRL
jgi:hypothetical protein